MDFTIEELQFLIQVVTKMPVRVTLDNTEALGKLLAIQTKLERLLEKTKNETANETIGVKNGKD